MVIVAMRVASNVKVFFFTKGTSPVQPKRMSDIVLFITRLKACFWLTSFPQIEVRISRVLLAGIHVYCFIYSYISV